MINAGATSQLPLKVNEGSATFYWISGQPKDSTRDQVAIIPLVTRDYFPTISARLREGRGIAVRTTAVEPAALVSAIRQAIWSIDKNQPMWRVQTLEDTFKRQLPTPTQTTALMAAFALLALLLASVGLYGVLSYAATQRTSEIGVRMALRATPREILLTFGKTRLAVDGRRSHHRLGTGNSRFAFSGRSALWLPS